MNIFVFHVLGVGGFVVNDDGELLVVQEKYRTADHWKPPGGMVDHSKYTTWMTNKNTSSCM